jgi:uncharacterized integral membrane protein
MTYFDYVKQQFNVFVYVVCTRVVMIFFMENFTRYRVDYLDPAEVFGWTVGIIFIGAYIRYLYFGDENRKGESNDCNTV